MYVLHVDIGGGTSNLALIKDGKIIETGCLNIGGRLIKFDNLGKVRYVSPVICGLCDISVGDIVTEKQVEAIVEVLVSVLEMAAGKREASELLKKLTTVGTAVNIPQEHVMLSFSGGVADCIEHDIPWLQYGDIGPLLGKAIKNSRLCKGEYAIGKETIRATVIGAGCHSTTLSGSTVFYSNVRLPIKNMPAVCFSEYVRRDMARFEENVIIAIGSQKTQSYDLINKLADEIVNICGNEPIYVCTEQDMAKALGQALALRTGDGRAILCIDRIKISDGDYLDIGEPVGPALPVVIKTLVLSQ